MFFVPAVPIRTGTSLINTLGNLGLLTNLKLCLDAGDVNSYDGTSQTWKDLSGGGYDFYRGTTNASQATDPTFNGTAGKQSSGEYFSYDGGDYFTLGQANPAWLQTFHKTGAKLTIALWGYLNNITSTSQAGLGFGDSAAISPFNGFQCDLSAATLLAFDFACANVSGVALDLQSTALLNNNAWNFAAVSVDIAAGNIIFQINGTTETHTGQSYSSPSAGSAGATLQIGALGANQIPDASGCRINSVSVFDNALTGAQMLAIYNATKGKFGL